MYALDVVILQKKGILFNGSALRNNFWEKDNNFA